MSSNRNHKPRRIVSTQDCANIALPVQEDVIYIYLQSAHISPECTSIYLEGNRIVGGKFVLLLYVLVYICWTRLCWSTKQFRWLSLFVRFVYMHFGEEIQSIILYITIYVYAGYVQSVFWGITRILLLYTRSATWRVPSLECWFFSIYGIYTECVYGIYALSACIRTFDLWVFEYAIDDMKRKRRRFRLRNYCWNHLHIACA